MVSRYGILKNCTGFQWDGGNSTSNYHRHDLTTAECEEVFFNRPIAIADDMKHPQNGDRYIAYGKTSKQRNLVVVFTVRGESIRIICAKDMESAEKRTQRGHGKEESAQIRDGGRREGLLGNA